MIAKIFRWSFLTFLIVMALVEGGAFYQTISIVPFWQKDISMFTNYGHWGIDYFPILSPLMTVLWLTVVVTGFKVKLPNKAILYMGHFLFLAVMVSTFAYFAPFLLTYMGNPQDKIPGTELAAMLNTWASWDFVRQVVGLISLSLFIFCYGKTALATAAIKIS